jgi:hypothetical protein
MMSLSICISPPHTPSLVPIVFVSAPTWYSPRLWLVYG